MDDFVYVLLLMVLVSWPVILVALVIAFLVGMRTPSMRRATVRGGLAGAGAYSTFFLVVCLFLATWACDGPECGMDVYSVALPFVLLAIVSTVVVPLTFGMAWIGNMCRADPS